jgi:hypothetical protein
VVTFLGTLLGGFTFLAVQNAAPWERLSAPARASADVPSAKTETVVTATTGHAETKTAALKLSRDQLNRLGGIALGLAVLSLLLPRRSPMDSRQLTPQIVAETTGLTVVGSLFNGPKPRRRSSGRILHTWVGTGECIIFAAIALTVTACALNPALLATLRSNPITGYLHAVHHLTETVTGWVAPHVPLA